MQETSNGYKPMALSEIPANSSFVFACYDPVTHSLGETQFCMKDGHIRVCELGTSPYDGWHIMHEPDKPLSPNQERNAS